MGNIFERKEILKMLANKQARRKIFAIVYNSDGKTTKTYGHVVRVGDIVLTIIPYQSDKYVVCKNSL